MQVRPVCEHESLVYIKVSVFSHEQLQMDLNRIRNQNNLSGWKMTAVRVISRDHHSYQSMSSSKNYMQKCVFICIIYPYIANFIINTTICIYIFISIYKYAYILSTRPLHVQNKRKGKGGINRNLKGQSLTVLIILIFASSHFQIHLILAIH